MNWLKVNHIQTIDTSDLVLKSQLPKKKLEDIGNKIPNHNKYITINGFKKFSGAVFYETLKQSKLVTLNAVEQFALRDIFFFGNDGFKNMFVYQPIFITLNIKT